MSEQVKTIEVQVSLYGLEAVYQACYGFLDRAYIRLEGDPEGTVKVLIRGKDGASEKFLAGLDGEFTNELLHQALRLKVSDSNRKIREYIVARALASAEGVAGSRPAESCPQPGAPPAAESLLDEDLEKEIERLLAEVEQKGGEGDPLDIVVPWEEKHPGPEAPEAAPAKAGGSDAP